MIINNLGFKSLIPQLYSPVALKADPGFINAAPLIGNGNIANIPPKKRAATPISDECKQKIQELKARNKEIQPRKLREGRLTLIGLASLVSILTGPLLGVIGVGLCVTGGFLPLGLALIGLGGAMVCIGVPPLRYFHHKVKNSKEVAKNKHNITILKKINKDSTFKDDLIALRKELGITYLSIPTFAIKYDLNKLYTLKEVYNEERVQKPRKRDPRQLIYWDYTSYFNFLTEKVKLTNLLLNEIEIQLIIIDRAIQKNKHDNATVTKLQQRKKNLLERAKKFKSVRIDVLKNGPKIGEISPFAYSRLKSIHWLAKQPFPHLDKCLK